MLTQSNILIAYRDMVVESVDSALKNARLSQQARWDLQNVSPADPDIALLAEKLFTRDGIEDARGERNPMSQAQKC